MFLIKSFLYNIFSKKNINNNIIYNIVEIYYMQNYKKLKIAVLINEIITQDMPKLQKMIQNMNNNLSIYLQKSRKIFIDIE